MRIEQEAGTSYSGEAKLALVRWLAQANHICASDGKLLNTIITARLMYDIQAN